MPLGDGTLVQGVSFAPLYAALGIVRESRWEDWLPEDSRPSEVWYGQSPDGSFVVNWRNVLFARETSRPA